MQGNGFKNELEAGETERGQCSISGDAAAKQEATETPWGGLAHTCRFDYFL